MVDVIYIGFPLFILVIIGLIVLIVSLRNKSKAKISKNNLDPLYLEHLYQALGGASNMLKLSVEHKRLKVTVNEVKKIDANKLKELAIPAFMSGRELKLLIKDQTLMVESYLNQRRKEEL